jgi:alpha-ketoglutarate-dependent 2,4-dichlorophenoxyacetate dioxygenase
MHIAPLSLPFVARVEDIDLSKELTVTDKSALTDALKTYGVFHFPDQGHITKDGMRRVASLFGKPSDCGDITNLDENDKVRPLSAQDTKLNKGNEVWHVDMLVVPSPPIAALLLAKELPASGGGNTQFADLTGVWGTVLEEDRSNYLMAKARHTFHAYARRTGPDYPLEMVAKYKPGSHPLVTKEPLSGKPVVFFGSQTESTGRANVDVDDLIKKTTADHNVYTHKWTEGDLVVWNNRRTLHRVLPYDLSAERRRLWRIEAYGDPPKPYVTGGLFKSMLHVLFLPRRFTRP